MGCGPYEIPITPDWWRSNFDDITESERELDEDTAGFHNYGWGSD
jgi:hypothetical protein